MNNKLVEFNFPLSSVYIVACHYWAAEKIWDIWSTASSQLPHTQDWLEIEIKIWILLQNVVQSVVDIIRRDWHCCGYDYQGWGCLILSYQILFKHPAVTKKNNCASNTTSFQFSQWNSLIKSHRLKMKYSPAAEFLLPPAEEKWRQHREHVRIITSEWPQSREGGLKVVRPHYCSLIGLYRLYRVSSQLRSLLITFVAN